MALTIIIYCTLLIFNIWFFLIRPKISLAKRIAVVLKIVGVYAFLMAIFSQLGFMEALHNIDEELTSPDLYKFMSANFRIISFSNFLNANALNTSFRMEHTVLSNLYPLMMNITLLISVLFWLFYILMVLPFTYLAYVLSSVPVDAFLTVKPSYVFKIDGQPVDAIQLVKDNIPTFRSAAIAVASFLYTFSVGYINTRKQSGNNVWIKIREWFKSKATLLSILIYILKGILILAFLTNLFLGWKLPDLLENSSSTKGELVGVIIVKCLLLIIYALIFIRIHRFHKSMSAKE